jgi:anti-sigma-K factor RskA
LNLRTPERADALAAEYVLGTLRGPARRRFERLARSDPTLGEAVRRWEERLLPLAEELPPLAPPMRVWTAILARIRGSGRAARAKTSIWQSIGLWRGLALAGLAAVVALSVVLLRPAPEAPAETLVAVLSGPDAKPALIASADPKGRYLTVKALAPLTVAADRALQLWALPEKGNPRSLGLLATGRERIARILLPSPADQSLQYVPQLAISLEPVGGSPTGLPTGPVLFTGAVQRLY